MSAITVRKLPDDVKQRLRMRAAAHGRSMEAEAREILVQALGEPRTIDFSWIERLVAVGEELQITEIPEIPDTPVEIPDLGR